MKSNSEKNTNGERELPDEEGSIKPMIRTNRERSSLEERPSTHAAGDRREHVDRVESV